MRGLVGLLAFCLLSSCGFGEIPHGKDNNGYFKYEEECVKSHKESYTRLMPIGKTLMPQRHQREVCDSTKTVKRYINPQDIDETWLKHDIKSK